MSCSVRPEIAFNTLFILYILLSYDSTKERKFYNASNNKRIIIGLCVLSYYPLAPFVIFAMIIFHF